MGLGDGGNQRLILALRIVYRLIGLGNVFFQGDRVAQFPLAFTLQFLKARKIGLRAGETPRRGGEFHSKIFACLGKSFYAAESLEVSQGGVEIVGRDGNRCRQSTAIAGAAFRSQVFKITVMSGNDLMERGERAIEGGGASAEVGAAGDPRFGNTFLEHRHVHWAGGPHAAEVPSD